MNEHKIVPRAIKVYKPEILFCPKCKAKLKYCYTISNKVVQFTSGKYFRIKNMGYKCPNCMDHVYFSQTANKLSFKGYTYSAKIACTIFYYKTLHYSRERICDILTNNGIEISDRNIDILYKNFNELYSQDRDTIIKDNYEEMIEEFKEIRLSIDLITIEGTYFIIMYNYFTGVILSIWVLKSLDEDELLNTIGKYVNKYYPISLIASVRAIGAFLPNLKKIAPPTTKYISFSKF